MRLWALLVLSALTWAWANPTNQTPISIGSLSPKSLEMSAGGGERTVRFVGRGFSAVSSVQILRDDQRVRDFQVSFVASSDSVMEVKLIPDAGLAPAADYRLVLFTRRWSLWTPLRIEILPSGTPTPSIR